METPTEETPFDWLVVLQGLASGDVKADREEVLYLESLASDWPSCACGQLCKSLPREPNGEPKDKLLMDWGLNFMEYISEERWQDALDQFISIENRSKALLQQMGLVAPDERTEPDRSIDV